MPGFSSAEIIFQSSPSKSINPSGILDSLPQPITDFIKSAKDIGINAGNQFGKYINTSAMQSPINVNLNQIKDINITQWFTNIFQINSSNSIYQLVVKIFSAVGGLFIWILNIVIDLIKQLLSLVH